MLPCPNSWDDSVVEVSRGASHPLWSGDQSRLQCDDPSQYRQCGPGALAYITFGRSAAAPTHPPNAGATFDATTSPSFDAKASLGATGQAFGFPLQINPTAHQQPLPPTVHSHRPSTAPPFLPALRQPKPSPSPNPGLGPPTAHPPTNPYSPPIPDPSHAIPPSILPAPPHPQSGHHCRHHHTPPLLTAAANA